MPEQPKRIYEFGPFRFDADDHLLLRAGEVVPLAPKAADTLLALLAHRGHVLEKGELMKIVWPDTFVEEGGLARNISILRKVLGEEYIETIPKRGYRFVAPASEISGEAALAPPRRSKRRLWAAGVIGAAVALLVVAGWFWIAASASASLAVLPLKNLSNDPAQDYFSEGMTEALITNLAKIRTLRVIARNSVMRFQGPAVRLVDVGRDLGVGAVVEGTVLRSGDRVRINARLIDVKTGRLLWADSYERDLRDVLALQSEVAGAIAHEVRVKMTPQEQESLARSRPVDREAYHAYLKGRYLWNKRTQAALLEAIGFFQQAIDKDPSYALACAGLADTYALLGSNAYDALPPAKAMPLAKTAAMQALKIDQDLAEGHASLAYARLSYDWDLPGAEKEFRRAIELNPGYATAHHWYSHYYLAAGKLDKALAEMNKARELDPLSLVINVGAGWCYYYSRQYDRAIEAYRRTLELEPGFALAHQTLGMAYEQKGLHREAIAEFTQAVALSGASASTVAGLGHAYAAAGQRAKAEEQLARLREIAREKYVPALYFTSLYAGLGDRDQALEWLRKAVEERSDYLIYYKVDPTFDALRRDPRFQSMLRPLP
ncbi:MAG: tetratricopeptide repeat protein [Bryobacteraceae bacterium]|jgi:TolB-like protein/DNA-binding winged helix-turn-helix (wHTH) protein